MKTRILFVASNTTVGGQEVVLKRLLKNLDKTLYHADVFITDFKGPLHDEYEEYSDSLTYYRETGRGSIFTSIIKLLNINKYDYIHFFNLWWIYDAIPRIKRFHPYIKVVATLCVDLDFHKDVFAQELHYVDKIRKSFWALTTPSSLNTKFYPGITVVREGVPTDIFKPAEKKRKTVAWIGRIVFGKKAYLIPEIARRLPDYDFVMVGDEETDEYHEISVEKPGNLTFRIGLSEREVAEVLSTSEYFLFTSASEAMPLTILEALSSGCCVVSERVGDIPSVIEDGVNGHLIPENIDSVNWVAENLSSLDTSISDNARDTVLNGFTSKQMTKRYEFIYNVAGEHDQPRVAFLWWTGAYYKDFWEKKVDSCQNAIMKLSHDHVVQMYTSTDGKPSKKIVNGQSIYFYSTYRDLIINLKEFRPDMIFMVFFHQPTWKHVTRAFPVTWKALLHFGTVALASPFGFEVDMLIVQQDYLKRPVAICNRFPMDKVKVNPYCVNTNLFKPIPTEKTYTGVMVADFRKDIKRQHLLIKAWQHIPGKLLLLGRFERSVPSDYHEDCIYLAEKLGVADRITFMDEQPHEQIPDIIRQAKIAFLTSSHEGGSIALMEKMACGLPALVLSDCHGNTNKIIDGVDGLIAKPTPESIADKTLQLLENYEEMGRAASKRIRREFPYERMYQFYHSLVQTVMEEKR